MYLYSIGNKNPNQYLFALLVDTPANQVRRFYPELRIDFASILIGLCTIVASGFIGFYLQYSLEAVVSRGILEKLCDRLLTEILTNVPLTRFNRV